MKYICNFPSFTRCLFHFLYSLAVYIHVILFATRTAELGDQGGGMPPPPTFRRRCSFLRRSQTIELSIFFWCKFVMNLYQAYFHRVTSRLWKSDLMQFDICKIAASCWNNLHQGLWIKGLYNQLASKRRRQRILVSVWWLEGNRSLHQTCCNLRVYTARNVTVLMLVVDFTGLMQVCQQIASSLSIKNLDNQWCGCILIYHLDDCMQHVFLGTVCTLYYIILF